MSYLRETRRRFSFSEPTPLQELATLTSEYLARIEPDAFDAFPSTVAVAGSTSPPVQEFVLDQYQTVVLSSNSVNRTPSPSRQQQQQQNIRKSRSLTDVPKKKKKGASESGKHLKRVTPKVIANTLSSGTLPSTNISRAGKPRSNSFTQPKEPQTPQAARLRWAGGAFENSPPPSSLPLPAFCSTSSSPSKLSVDSVSQTNHHHHRHSQPFTPSTLKEQNCINNDNSTDIKNAALDTNPADNDAIASASRPHALPHAKNNISRAQSVPAMMMTSNNNGGKRQSRKGANVGAKSKNLGSRSNLHRYADNPTRQRPASPPNNATVQPQRPPSPSSGSNNSSAKSSPEGSPTISPATPFGIPPLEQSGSSSALFDQLVASMTKAGALYLAAPHPQQPHPIHSQHMPLPVFPQDYPVNAGVPLRASPPSPTAMYKPAPPPHAPAASPSLDQLSSELRLMLNISA
ncbi:LIM domain binding 3 [Balamuthia mandrillaris]